MKEPTLEEQLQFIQHCCSVFGKAPINLGRGWWLVSEEMETREPVYHICYSRTGMKLPRGDIIDGWPIVDRDTCRNCKAPVTKIAEFSRMIKKKKP